MHGRMPAPTDECAQRAGRAARFGSLSRTPHQTGAAGKEGEPREGSEESAVDRGERALLLRLSLLLLLLLLLQSADPSARNCAQRTASEPQGGEGGGGGGLVGLGLIKLQPWLRGMQQANKASCCALAPRSDSWRSS
jgi:hypothetical protein